MSLKDGLYALSPFLFRLVYSAYKATPIAKKRANAANRLIEARLAAVRPREFEIINTYLGGELVVRSGPFEGLKYIKYSSGSPFLPKLLGNYEAVIGDWISDAIGKQYDVIIDLGCAEGYYVVGF